MSLSRGPASARHLWRYSFHLLSLVLLSFSVATARAQGGSVDSSGTGGKNRIQGRIYSPSGRLADVPSIKVTLESTSSERIFVIADLNGSFTFNNLAPGSYSLTIDAGEAYETVRESVLIEGSGVLSRSISAADLSRTNVPRIFNVMISLQPKRGRPGAKPGVINAALANVPKPSAELYQKALQSVQSGDSKKAVEQLKAAISYYPEFALALNELGVQYLKLRQPDKAIEALRSALRIKPEEFTPRLNLGIALLENKEAAEAEVQLREVLKKNDASWTAHMYLGITLISRRDYDGAEKELQRSLSLGGKDLSLPHYYLGGIYWHRNEYQRAAEELERYLQLAPGAPNTDKVRSTIKELRAKR